MRCRDCRKLSKELDTYWDRIRLWFFYRFKNDIFDLKNDGFTEGYGEGYLAGFKEAMSKNKETYKEIFKV